MMNKKATIEILKGLRKTLAKVGWQITEESCGVPQKGDFRKGD